MNRGRQGLGVRRGRARHASKVLVDNKISRHPDRRQARLQRYCRCNHLRTFYDTRLWSENPLPPDHAEAAHGRLRERMQMVS